MRKAWFTLWFVLAMAPPSAAVPVTTVDLLREYGLTVNGAGPLLVRMDVARDRLIVPHTLTSSLSVIDGTDHTVVNIPTGRRALQHLKAECLTVSRKTGMIYLIATRCVIVVDPEARTSRVIETGVQFESVAVDEGTGNLFLAGRESAGIGFYDARRDRMRTIPWTDRTEPLLNLNATPPPPIRKVVADAGLGKVMAVDGFTSTLTVFDGRTGDRLSSRTFAMTSGARWHLAGYDERDHALYLVVETAERKVLEAGRIDALGGKDKVVPLPGFSEGVGILYNPSRREVYVPYDNHPSVHAVGFEGAGSVEEIRVPAYGNDASALDEAHGRLYVASWAEGEVDVIDLETRSLVRRIQGLGILPHMFTMAFDPRLGLLYYPRGATAVNGTFGAAVTALDPETGDATKIYTGWAPIDLAPSPDREGMVVFNSEDAFAEVRAGGEYEVHRLPHDYPVRALPGPDGDVYLSYGPHQSYWPVVYIWGARDGVLTIDRDLSFYDRRIPRQAQALALDSGGVLYFTQNNWGREEQFLGVLEDDVRLMDIQRRIALGDTVDRENTQRILVCDAGLHRLYLVRVGEKDEDPSVLQAIDLATRRVLRRVDLGRTASDLLLAGGKVYVSNFDSGTVSVVDTCTFEVETVSAGGQPLKLSSLGNRVYAIDAGGNRLLEVAEGGRVFEIPGPGRPDNLLAWNGGLVITSHSGEDLRVLWFDPEEKRFALLHRQTYAYGETGFGSRNASFYTPGQFGDALFSLTRGVEDGQGSLWLTDFLSGRVLVISPE